MPPNISDFSASLIVNSSLEEAFRSVSSEIDKWWSKVEGESNKLGDQFKVSFGPDSYWIFQVKELIPSSRIIWHCIESHQDHHLEGMDAEWTDSIQAWEFKEVSKDEVEINFVHQGLSPEWKCFDICSSGWNNYILNSLKSYLETGIGQPSQK